MLGQDEEYWEKSLDETRERLILENTIGAKGTKQVPDGKGGVKILEINHGVSDRNKTEAICFKIAKGYSQSHVHARVVYIGVYDKRIRMSGCCWSVLRIFELAVVHELFFR